MAKDKFPQFNRYACVGDSIQWQKDGFDIVARIEFDNNSFPDHFDCYSPKQKARWRADEWFFCGIVLSVSRNGVQISDHAASLWAIECNISRAGNRYLSEVAQELESEAIEYARKESARMVAALGE